MNIPSIQETTSEERTWAALTHISVVFLFWGFIFPLMIWATQRKKSAFVAFHALQALTYQIFEIPVWLVWSLIAPLLAVPVIVFVVGATSRQSGDLPILVPFLIQFGMFGWMLCGLVLYFVPGVLAMIFIFARRDFYYPLLGQWLKRYLSTESAQ